MPEPRFFAGCGIAHRLPVHVHNDAHAREVRCHGGGHALRCLL
ncbi:MAG: hypothetical protein ACK55Z_12740 [bacterium]